MSDSVSGEPPRRADSDRVLWRWEALFVVSLFIGEVAWFTSFVVPKALGVLSWLSALGSALRIFIDRGVPLRALKPRTDTLAVFAAATALRLPALVAPAGFVGADGSLQGLLALGLLNGLRPAPIFLSGSSYEGSLKAHIAAGLGVLTGHQDVARLLVIASLLLWFVFIAATMSLARRVAGPVAGVAAGLFVALSPRFATVFSVSNAGPYADALGLGTLALAWTAGLLGGGGASPTRRDYFGVGLVLGVGFWQQPIVVSYAAVAILGLLADALWRRRIAFLAVPLGLFVGRLPATLHDLSAGGAAASVMTRYARGAGSGLSLQDQITGTLTWAFPVVFAGVSGETSLSDASRGFIGVLCFALVLWFALGRGGQVLRELAARRFSPALWPLAHFGAGLALVWLVAGEGQYTRPRYFLPLLGAFAMMFGALIARLWSSTRLLAAAPLLLVLGSNVTSNLPRLREGLAAGRELRDLAAAIEKRGLRTGYSDFLISGPLSMVTNERVTVAGLLGPTGGEHLPRQIEKVAREGPDFYLVRPDEEAQLARRLQRLGVTFETFGETVRVFWRLSRRVPIEEVEGFRDDQ